MSRCLNCKHHFRESRPNETKVDLICFHNLSEKMGTDAKHARLEFCDSMECFEPKEEWRS